MSLRFGSHFLPVLLTACSVYPQSPAQADFARAMQLAARGQFVEAEQVLRELAQAYPKEFEVQYRLGVILLRQNKTAEAASRLASAVELSPGSPLAWLALAQARLKTGDRKAALDAAGCAAQLPAADAPVWRALAMFYAEAGDFARAMEFEERWGRASPGDTGSRQRLAEYAGRAGDSHRSAKEPAKAVEAYQKAMRLAPEEPSTYFKLVALFLDHRTPTPAIAILDNAVTRFPKEPEFRRLLGLAHYQIGDTASAIDAFLAMADLDPDSEIGIASLETLLDAAGVRLPQIVSRIRRFRTRKPSSPAGHFLLAKALALERSSAAQIESLLREAISADARFWPAHYELGRLLENEGKADQALSAFTKAVALNPDYAPVHFALAHLYGRSGDRARAVEHRRRHHELVEQQRRQAEGERAASPMLPYRIEGPDRRQSTP